MELPGSYYPDDKKWITEQLGMVAHSVRNGVILRYAEVYEEAYANTLDANQKACEARREANTRLRLFVERRGILEQLQKPPLSR